MLHTGTMTSAKSPYSVRLTNPSELFGQLDSGLTLDGTQVFTFAGSIGTVNTNDVDPTLSPVTAVGCGRRQYNLFNYIWCFTNRFISKCKHRSYNRNSRYFINWHIPSFTIACYTQTVTRAFTISTTNILHVGAYMWWTR